jgi:4-hydroxy-tetrahydrodipicolinate synthase
MDKIVKSSQPKIPFTMKGGNKMDFAKSEAKQWAKKHFKGLEGAILPSFTPDLADLDEEGIRWDVQHFIKQGYFSILCSIEACGMTNQERNRFMEIACDEAKSKIMVSMAMMVDTVDGDIQLLKHFEKVGGTAVLVGYPVQYYPKSEEEVYEVTKEICDSTNLAVVIYPAPAFNFVRFHPSSFPLKLLRRMAEITNVVGLKVGGQQPIAFAAECFRLCGDQILVNSPIHQFWPVTVPQYGQQWAGGSCYDQWQTPDDQRAVKMFNLLRSGELDKAMDIYWRLAPIRNFTESIAAYSAGGHYHFNMWKYHQWLAGGNGGTLRQPVGRLFDPDKEALKAALKAAGIKAHEAPEEEFYIGKVNFAKGARLKRRTNLR